MSLSGGVFVEVYDEGVLVEVEDAEGGVGGLIEVEDREAAVAVVEVEVDGPQGVRGPAGPPNVLSVGTVTTGAAGSAAAAAITGESPVQELDLAIPRGDKGEEGDVGPAGPPNSLSVGTVTTGAAGSQAAAAVTGAAPAQTLDLTIPRGDTGAKGDKGDTGDLTPRSSGTVSGGVSLVQADLPSTKRYTLGGNVTSFGLPSMTGLNNVSGTITVIVKQAASGGPYTFAWPALEWPNDAPAPVMPTVANAELIVHLFWTGEVWRAMVGGVFFP